MNKKTYNLLVGLTGGVIAIASALVTYFQPPFASAIVGSLVIVETATVECFGLFLKDE